MEQGFLNKKVQEREESGKLTGPKRSEQEPMEGGAALDERRRTATLGGGVATGTQAMWL